MEQAEAMAGCRVVVTRPADTAEELANPLRQLGAEVRVRPLIRIAPPADPAPLRAALQRLDSFDWVAFTSANAVRACAAAAPAGARWPAVAAVGSGTARAATAAGMPVRLVPGEFSGEALANALAETGEIRGAHVFWPRASGARETFGAVLRQAGADVAEVVCYQTVPDELAAAALRDELRADGADVLVFTSPSAVRTFAAVAQSPPAAAVAVIGAVTATAVGAAGWQVKISPAEQSLAGLVAALRDWWSGAGP